MDSKWRNFAVLIVIIIAGLAAYVYLYGTPSNPSDFNSDFSKMNSIFSDNVASPEEFAFVSEDVSGNIVSGIESFRSSMPKKSGPAWDLSAIYLDEVGILGGQSLLTQKITANVETFDGVLPEDNCPALSEINSDLSALQDLRADYDSLFLKLSSFKQKYPAQASTAKIDAIESHLLVRQSDLEATISASTKFYNSLEEFCGVGA